ncbi:MAG: hypothetical protein AAF959_29855 [Cyanobacteria bacterium P01_D01_bin.56]
MLGPEAIAKAGLIYIGIGRSHGHPVLLSRQRSVSDVKGANWMS